MAKRSSSPVQVILVEPEKLKQLQKRMGEKVAIQTTVDEMDLYGRKLVEALANVSPVREGKFRLGFDHKVVKSGKNAGSLKVTWNAPDRPKDLLTWIVKGTGIYGARHRPITPKRAPALKWKDVRGRWHSSKSVRGMKPNDIIGKAIRNTAQARQLLAERVGKITLERLIDKK